MTDGPVRVLSFSPETPLKDPSRSLRQRETQNVSFLGSNTGPRDPTHVFFHNVLSSREGSRSLFGETGVLESIQDP